LKQYVVNAARAADADAVVSLVHRDNEAMLAINLAFGARFVVDDAEHFLCVIAL
jgi:hypothetical protein